MSSHKPSPTPPLAWLKTLLARSEASRTGFVWKKRPLRSDPRSERDDKAWNSAFAGTVAGTKGDKEPPKIRLRYGGRQVTLDVRALATAFDTGEWPTGKLPPWKPSDTVEPSLNSVGEGDREGVRERLRVESDYVGPGVLAQYFAAQCREHGYAPDELTVLQKSVDPFRLDIPVRRRDAEWFARWFSRRIAHGDDPHLREIHYVLSSPPPIKKPDAETYRNDWPNWRWLLMSPAKAARWLCLVPWSRIPDNRGEDPVIRRPMRAGEAAASFLIDLPVPDELDVTPTPDLAGFGADQPFALAIFTEKSSVAGALETLATRYGANLYVSSGDMVDRRIWEMARDGNADARKLVVFTVADCDPSGYGMPRAIARKLQAHAVATFPGLRFEVVRAALTPDQARHLELPDAPLKPTERRADRWFEALGIGQIELDAALALRRESFVAAVEQAILPYFDGTLATTVAEARLAWEEEAEAAIAEQVDLVEIETLQQRYDAAREEIEAINDRLSEIAETIQLPDPPAPPQPDMTDKIELRSPLIDSSWGFVEATLKLKVDKAYEGDEGAP